MRNNKSTLFSLADRIHRAISRYNGSSIQVIGVILGALLASIGLELFLMPHGIIVGGMTGLSALFALYTEMRLGLFLLLLNIPFIVLQRRHLDTSFAICAVVGLFVLSLFSVVMHPFPAITEHPLLAALAGGTSLGLGLGLAVRFGGSLDPATSISRWSHFKLPFSIEWILLLLNCSILIAAGFYFGFEQALYSIIAYISAFETVKIPLRGLPFTRPYIFHISSDHCPAIQRALKQRLNRKAQFLSESLDGDGGILVCQCNRWETARLKAIVKDIDPGCTITLHSKHNATS
ncbi:YitT family protein [Paenibacillus lentus]|uniref:YitT family protein n=1 Tax=Paenibacillus lentus TaxID=1338368 RepID=UPI003667D726